MRRTCAYLLCDEADTEGETAVSHVSQGQTLRTALDGQVVPFEPKVRKGGLTVVMAHRHSPLYVI